MIKIDIREMFRTCIAKSSSYRLEKLVTFTLLLFNLNNLSAQTDLNVDHYKKGHTFYIAKEYSKAIVEFDLAILQQPKNYRAYTERGYAKISLNLLQESINDFSKALEINQLDTLAIVGRAYSLLNTENFEQSLIDFKRARQLDSTNQNAILGLAQSYAGLDDYKNAISEFNKFIKSNPRLYTSAYLKRGEVYLKDRKFRLAISDFNHYEKIGGELSIVYYYRGICYFRLNKPDSAIVDLKQYLATNEKAVEPYKFIGGAYAINKDSIRAREYFEKGLQIDPEDGETLYYYALAEEHFKNYTQAAKLLEKVKPYISPLTVQNLLVFGYASAGIKDTLSAVKYFEDAIAMAPNDSMGYASRARLYYSGTRYGKPVLNDLNKLIELFKSKEKRSLVYTALGFYYFKQGDLASCRKFIDKALMVSPHSLVAKLAEAILEFTSKNHQKAIKQFESIVRENSKNSNAYLFLAHAQKINGNSEQACKAISNAKSNGVDIQEKAVRGICSSKLVESNKDIVALFEILVTEGLVAK